MKQTGRYAMFSHMQATTNNLAEIVNDHYPLLLTHTGTNDTVIKICSASLKTLKFRSRNRDLRAWAISKFLFN
jgi:hypothetical protein